MKLKGQSPHICNAKPNNGRQYMHNNFEIAPKVMQTKLYACGQETEE